MTRTTTIRKPVTTTNYGIAARDLIGDKPLDEIRVSVARTAFQRYCEANGSTPTKRQAAKWLRENGALISNLSTAKTA